MIVEFKKAVRYKAKARVSLIGPAGSGKSLTMLRLARVLAGPTGRIAAIDTEHGSLSKYAPAPGMAADNLFTFDFSVIELSSFSPENFIGALSAAEKGGFDVFCGDSFSHFWIGKDGALEFVDARRKAAKARGGDQMEGWKDYSPLERSIVESILASPCHVLVTMRTKNEYRDEEYFTDKGAKKTRRVKIGLAPIQRDGLDYEFDLVGVMTDENEMVIDKTRCPHYAEAKVLAKPTAKDFEPFATWLQGEEPPAAEKPVEEWRKAAETKFGEIETRIGSEALLTLLQKHGFKNVKDLPNRETALKVFRAMDDESVFLPRVAPESKPSPAAEPARPAHTAQASATVQPDAFQQIAAGMTNAATIVKTFQDLRARAARMTSDEAADTLVQEALGRHGVDHPGRLKSLSVARKCARELWEKLQSLEGETIAESMVA